MIDRLHVEENDLRPLVLSNGAHIACDEAALARRGAARGEKRPDLIGEQLTCWRGKGLVQLRLCAERLHSERWIVEREVRAFVHVLEVYNHCALKLTASDVGEPVLVRGRVVVHHHGVGFTEERQFSIDSDADGGTSARHDHLALTEVRPAARSPRAGARRQRQDCIADGGGKQNASPALPRGSARAMLGFVDIT